MIVADANLIAYLCIAGPHTASAEKVFLKDHEWAVPALWRSELLSILTATMRHADMTETDALRVYSRAETLVRSREYMPKAERVLSFTGKSRCSSYDCEYLALADELHLRLVTFDRELYTNFPKIAVAPTVFLG
jgi:predicted nucleic acid-binding protein